MNVRRWLGPMALSAAAHAVIALVPLGPRSPVVHTPAEIAIDVELIAPGSPVSNDAVRVQSAAPAAPAAPDARMTASPARGALVRRTLLRPGRASEPAGVDAHVSPSQPADHAPALPLHPAPLNTGTAGTSALSALPATTPPAPSVAVDHGAYAARVRSRIEATKRYPGSARRRRMQGEVTLAIVVGPDGRLAAARVLRSSGASLLDREAERMARAAAPFPPSGTARALELVVPVRFSLSDP